MLLIKRDIFTSLMYEFLTNTKSRHTSRAYKTDLKAFFIYLSELENINNLKDVKSSHILYYRDRLLEQYAPGTVNRKMASLSKFFNYLILKEIVEKNPVTLIERPYQNPVTPTNDLTLEEIQNLVNKVNESKNRIHILVINLLLVTGLRRQEIVDLRYCDIKKSDQGYYLEVFGKRGKKITKLITNELFEQIIEARSQYKREVLPSDYILKGTGKSGKYGTTTVYSIVEKYAKLAGITKKITPHSLRSTYVTQGLVSGIPIEIMAIDMAHSNIETTRKYYKKIQSLKDSPIHKMNYLKNKS